VAGERELLGASVARLRRLVESLGPEQLRVQAYPSAWTVADVLSHLGSAAVIAALWVDQSLGGAQVVPQLVWDEWNAKDPDAKAADALRADQAFLDRLDATRDAERERFVFEMGPLRLDYEGFIRIRINEHVLHTWDVAVAFDPEATLAPDAVPTVIEALPMIAGWAGKPTGTTIELQVHTVAPEQRYAIRLSGDGVALGVSDPAGAPDLELPAEAFIRLVYGRLDPEHTPAFMGDEADLDELRRAFPGL
jgi:uncharacterized protein (TIGR03083 family)